MASKMNSGFSPSSVHRDRAGSMVNAGSPELTDTDQRTGSTAIFNSPQSPLSQFERSVSAICTPTPVRQAVDVVQRREQEEDRLHSKYMMRRQLVFERDDPTGEKRAGIARAAARAQARADIRALEASRVNLAFSASGSIDRELLSTSHAASGRPTTPSPLSSGPVTRLRPDSKTEQSSPQTLMPPSIPRLRQVASDSRLNRSSLTVVTTLSPSPSQTLLSSPQAGDNTYSTAKDRLKKGLLHITSSVKSLGDHVKSSPRLDLTGQPWARSPNNKHSKMAASIVKGKTTISGPVGDVVKDFQVEGEFKEQLKTIVYEGSIPLARPPVMGEIGGGAATVAELQAGHGNPFEHAVSSLKYFDISNRNSPRSAERVSRLPRGTSRLGFVAP